MAALVSAGCGSLVHWDYLGEPLLVAIDTNVQRSGSAKVVWLSPHGEPVAVSDPVLVRASRIDSSLAEYALYDPPPDEVLHTHAWSLGTDGGVAVGVWVRVSNSGISPITFTASGSIEAPAVLVGAPMWCAQAFVGRGSELGTPGYYDLCECPTPASPRQLSYAPETSLYWVPPQLRWPSADAGIPMSRLLPPSCQP